MTQNEIEKALIEAAYAGNEEDFDRLAGQLEKTIDNMALIHVYSGILIGHPEMRRKALAELQRRADNDARKN